MWLLMLIFGACLVFGNVLTESEVEKFRLDVLVEHNLLRARHGTAKLTFNSDLNDLAQLEAFRYSKSKSKPPSVDQYVLGFNKVIYKGYRDYSGTEFSDFLYSKGKDFNYTSGLFQNAGSFTQLLWKNSKYIGVGICKTKYATYMVALYFPAGNIVGDVINNVQPLIDKISKTRSTKSPLFKSTKSNDIFVTKSTTKPTRPFEASDNRPALTSKDDDENFLDLMPATVDDPENLQDITTIISPFQQLQELTTESSMDSSSTDSPLSDESTDKFESDLSIANLDAVQRKLRILNLVKQLIEHNSKISNILSKEFNALFQNSDGKN